MPLLKFICKDCNLVFDELTSADKRPPCPNCGSENVERHYQGKCYFGGGNGKGMAAGCSGNCSCCSGCSNN